MGIRQIQTNRVIENIIHYYLKYGRYPTFKTITHHFSQWLREHTPGAPIFNPIKVFRKQTSNSQTYNQNIEMIYTDLSDAYQATIQQNKQLIKNFDYNETERKKIQQALQELSDTIDELLMVTGNADYKYFKGKMINFKNLDYVDQEKSTILADLNNQIITLKENIQQTRKVPLLNASTRFQPLMPSVKTEALQPMNNAFDDAVNTAWWQVVKSETPGSLDTENSMGMRAELVILFNQQETINEITYQAHHGKPVYISVDFTTDGSSFIPLPGQNNSRKVVDIETWQFEPITATGIRFTFEKKEHDDFSAGVYQFYFGAKDISVYHRSYQSQGVLITKPITFDQNIKALTIDTQQAVPLNASIQYEVALNDANKEIEELTWHPISPINDLNPQFAKQITFNTKTTQQVDANRVEPTGEVINGMTVFRLLKDNGDGLISEQITDENTGEVQETFDDITQAQLFRGINQWRREQCYIPFDGSVPLNNVWENVMNTTPQMITIDYLPIENTLKLEPQQKNNFFRFTTCIYSPKEQTYPMTLTVIHTMPSGIRKRIGTYSVYVNKQRLIPENDKVTMPFKSGWNEIQILYHWGDLQLRADLRPDQLPTQTMLGQFNFSRQEKVRADLLPMTYTDVHSLFYNIAPNNHDYFSIHERQVVLNYNPKNCRFQLLYETNNSDDQTANEILLRATLKIDPIKTDVTPQIKSIRILAK